MIKPIDGLPEGVLGFEAIGEITIDDYRDILEPAVERSEGSGRKLRLLAVLGPEFSGFKGEAVLEDARLGLSSWSAWERIAVVTDHDGIAGAIGLLGWLIPGEVRVFPVAEGAEAVTWISAP